MCGIVGYVGPQRAQDVVIDGLRRLEYRGYDSAGIAVVHDGELAVAKRSGKLANLEKELADHPLPAAHTAIGHTRWATHGPPNDANAHPHTGGARRIALVHNGIIENFAELRARIEADDHVFLSETDTEIAAHLVELQVQSGIDLPIAMQRVCQQLDGAFTLVAVDAEDPDRVVAARRNSPLVVGLGEGENFLGSDVAAFIEHTREALELGQDQIVTITRDEVTVTDFWGTPVEVEQFHVDWDLSAAEKDGHDWFMRKEIFEQPRAVADSLIGRRGLAGLLQLDEMRLADEEIRDLDKIIIIACGTSFYAGMVAKYAIEHWTRTPVEVELASEFRYRDPIVDHTTLVVAISQSGETADTLQAIRHAKSQRAKVLAICNTNGSSIPRESDAVIYTHAGPEIGVASTKGFLTQLVACYLLALYVAQVKGTRYGDEIDEIMEQLEAMPGPHRDRARAGRGRLRARAVTRRHPVGALPRPARRLPGGSRGRAEAQGAGLHPRGGFRGRRAQARPDRLGRGRPAGAVRRTSSWPRPAARQDAERHPGGPCPRRAHHLPRRGGRRQDRAVRRPPDPAAAGPRAAPAAGRDRAAPAVRLRAGQRARPRRRPAAQPRQVRHGRVKLIRVAVIGVGIDVCELDRFAASIERTPALAVRLFTEAERTLPMASLAARFAAKEALAKALGAPRGMEWHDAEVIREESGRPVFMIRGTVRAQATALGVQHIHLSLSHDAGIASAMVVLES